MLRTLVRRNQITDVVHLHLAPTAADDVRCRATSRRPTIPVTGCRCARRAPRPAGPGPDQERTGVSARPGRVRAGGRSTRPTRSGHRRRQRPTAPGAVRSVQNGARWSGRDRHVRPARQSAVAADVLPRRDDAGWGAGVQLPFGCRMGICQSRGRPVEGHVRDSRTGQRCRARNPVQTCVGPPG